MASVRAQIFAAVKTKLDGVVLALAWNGSVHVNPREPLGDDQLSALVLLHGGDRTPQGLTGHVEQCWAEFSVGLMVREGDGETAEELLDAGFVAVSDALLDPADIQLSGLAVAIERGEVSDPVIGRAKGGARVLGGQSIEFAVQYWEREGDASTPGP